MRKKKTEIQKEYDKAWRNLQRRIKKLEKQGYVVDTTIKKAKVPRKKSIEKIKGISTPELIRASYKIDYETGEIIPATTIIKNKKELKKKLKDDRSELPTISIIDEIIKRIKNIEERTQSHIPKESRINELLRIFYNTIKRYRGKKEKLIDYLKRNEERIFEIIEVITYESDDQTVGASFVELARILNIDTLNDEQSENISTMSEYSNYKEYDGG